MSHYKQYPPGTEKVYSYFESRGGKYEEVCFFGLQYFIKRYLVGAVVTQAKIDEVRRAARREAAAPLIGGSSPFPTPAISPTAARRAGGGAVRDPLRRAGARRRLHA